MGTPEHDFAQFRATGSALALAAVFDALAPELLLVAAHVAPRGVEAEDIVQATFLSAIEGADRWDAARPLLPWLIGILVHTVRAETRRRDRQPDPARLPPRVGEPTPPQASEAHELAEQVASALRELPVPYRQVLSLRLVHGLSAVEIAHTLACPLATVKTRLQRGLDRLREALPAGLASSAAVLLAGRGLAAARQAVLEAAAGVGPVASATVSSVASATVGAGVAGVGLVGGMFMKKVLVGVGAIVLTSVAWMAWPRDAAPSPPTALGVDAPVVLVVGSQPARTPTVDASAAPARTAVALPIFATTGALRVVCVWKEDGAPADSVRISWHHLDSPSAQQHTAMADTAGSTLVTDLAPGRYWTRASAGRSWQSTHIEVRVGEQAEVKFELEPDSILEGLVVDLDARAVASAAVRAFDLERREIRTLATTASDGSFRWRGRRMVELWAEKPGHQPSALTRTGSEDSPPALRLQLGGRGCAVAGIVLDPTGAPAGEALVAITVDERTHETRLPDGSVDPRRPPLVMRADANGRFATSSVPAGRHTVLARSPGFAAARVEVDVAEAAGDPVTLRLPRGCTVHGTLRDEKGQPLSSEGVGFVYAIPTYTVVGLDPASHQFLRTDAVFDACAGYSMHGVQPGAIWIFAEHGRQHVYREVELTEGQELSWDPVLGGGPRITGRVVDARGEPLARWEVQAIPLGLGTTVHGHVGTSWTDDAGRFTLADVVDSEHRVIAVPLEVGGAAARMPWAVEPRVRPDGNEIVLRTLTALGDGGWIAGEVLGPDGNAMADAQVIVTPVAGVTGFQPSERLDTATGRFAIGPLPPDEYHISVSVEGKGSISLDPRSLAPRQKLDLGTIRFAAPGTATVAFAPDGAAPGADLDLVLRGSGGYAHDFFALEDGARRSVPVLPGSYKLEVWGPGIAPLTRQVEVVSAGDTRTMVTLQTAADVTIEVVPEAPSTVALLLVDLCVEDGASNAIYRRLTQVHRKGDVYSWTRGLPPGEYRVTARRMMPFADGEARFAVPAGTIPLTVRVALAPTGR